MVSSVDLTQSPPLLSINGQTYTVSQIQSITELAVSVAESSSRILNRFIHGLP